MEIPQLTSVTDILFATAIFFVVIMLRYFLVGGFFFLFFHKLYRKHWQQHRLNTRSYRDGQFRKEIGWSCITGLIFAVTGTFTLWLWQHGFTLIYLTVNSYGWIYLPVSFILLLFIHETYYYWLHRWMHQPRVFKLLHKVHHDSYITSPWTAFSFHPLEGLLQAIILPVSLVIVPIHPYVLLLQLLVMSFSSVINHLDIELYPASFNRNKIMRWLIGATHHSLHHQQYRFNFGLYFTFWDKWKRTESPAFDALFEEKSVK